MSEKTLPHNLEAERSVLGVMLVNPDALYQVGDKVEIEDFYLSSHQRVYAAMVDLAARNVPPDLISLKNELDRRGELVACGGPAYLASLADGVPKSTNVVHYAGIVREKSMLRKLIQAGNRVVTASYESDEDAATVLETAERTLLAISEDVDAGALLFMDRVVPGTLELLAAIYETKRAITGAATGIRDLDDITRGLQPANLIVLGGRPGEGKSALGLQIAAYVAKTQGPVAFFSMEMSREELTTRAAAQLARVDHHDLMQGKLAGSERERVWRALSDLGEMPLAIDDHAAQTPYQIRSKAKTIQARHGLKLVVVDYLQLLRRPRNANSREEAVAENTWALKVLAGDLKVPVLALSQLNRSSVKDERRPSLSDLRESGAVEQHANVVLLLYRPPAEGNGIVVAQPPVELLVAKQRNGRSQVKVDLVFNGPSMRFEEVAYGRTA